MRNLVVLLSLLLATLAFGAEKAPDPTECEVCVKVIEDVRAMIPKDKWSDKLLVEDKLGKSGSVSGAGVGPSDVAASEHFKCCPLRLIAHES